jgi:glucose-1-phosphate thymidylyltransferase|tara:strand:- start:2419 stop:3279 length:861 start_codon:yes stop_codon:yes gene_type:complete
MKGIILAGGDGTRLNPITISYSKQLVPIFDKPLIYYPLTTLMNLNIRDILIIVKTNQKQNFEKLLKDGSQFGLNISYAIQDNPNGIAEALIIGENHYKNENVALILGDNIFYGHDISNSIDKINITNKGVIFLYQVSDPTRYGVANFNGKKIIKIIEKPKQPKSNFAVTGLYIYDKNVKTHIRNLKPSKRNELEITDLNNIYANKNKIEYIKLNNTSVWFDAGTFNSLLHASQYIQALQERKNIVIASPEEIAFKKKYISRLELKKLIKKMPKNSYSRVLCNLLKD